MSVQFSGTNQGFFTSTGVAQILQLPSNVDWLWVKNLTTSYASGASTGAEFYWQRGMTQGLGTIYTKTTSTNALTVGQVAANAGFFLVNSTFNIPGPSLTFTAITNGTPPVVDTANTGSLVTGDIVRIFNTTGGQQLGGLDFTIGTVVSGTSFTLAYMQPIAAATGGTFRVIPYSPYFYPSLRYITNISQATQAIVTLSVTHNYTVGQKINFIIPTVSATAFGMTQLDGMYATIVAINQADANGYTNTITVDVDTTGFTAFAFPLTTDLGFTPAQVIPVGENTAVALNLGQNILADATVNTAFFGMQLQAGTGSPAGVSGNLIYWVAGKSFSNNGS